MYLVQATVAMAGWTLSELQQQEFVLAQEDTLSTHRKDLIPEPHTRTSKRMANDRQRGTFHILDPTKDLHTITSYEYPRKTFIQAPVQSIVKIAMQGTCWGWFQQDLPKIFSQESRTGHARTSCMEDFTKICTRASYQQLWPRSSCQDPKEKPTRAIFLFCAWHPEPSVARRFRVFGRRRPIQKYAFFYFGCLRHKTTCCCWRGSYKILIQEPPKSIPEELS